MNKVTCADGTFVVVSTACMKILAPALARRPSFWCGDSLVFSLGEAELKELLKAIARHSPGLCGATGVFDTTCNNPNANYAALVSVVRGTSLEQYVCNQVLHSSLAQKIACWEAGVRSLPLYLSIATECPDKAPSPSEEFVATYIGHIQQDKTLLPHLINFLRLYPRQLRLLERKAGWEDIVVEADLVVLLRHADAVWGPLLIQVWWARSLWHHPMHDKWSQPMMRLLSESITKERWTVLLNCTNTCWTKAVERKTVMSLLCDHDVLELTLKWESELQIDTAKLSPLAEYLRNSPTHINAVSWDSANKLDWFRKNCLSTDNVLGLWQHMKQLQVQQVCKYYTLEYMMLVTLDGDWKQLFKKWFSPADFEELLICKVEPSVRAWAASMLPSDYPINTMLALALLQTTGVNKSTLKRVVAWCISQNLLEINEWLYHFNISANVLAALSLPDSQNLLHKVFTLPGLPITFRQQLWNVMYSRILQKSTEIQAVENMERGVIRISAERFAATALTPQQHVRTKRSSAAQPRKVMSAQHSNQKQCLN
jgi:hypothetical protein